MANLRGAISKTVEITLEIPIKATTTLSDKNKLALNVQVDAARAKRFLRKMARLCRRYGYGVIITDDPKSEGK